MKILKTMVFNTFEPLKPLFWKPDFDCQA